LHDAGNVQDTPQGWKNIYIELPIKTDAVFTPTEIKKIEGDIVTDMAARGIKLMSHVLSKMKTVFSFNGVTGATYDDGRKIEGTRALQIKTDRDAVQEMSTNLSSVINRVLSEAEVRLGKVCVAFHPESGRRYSLRGSAQEVSDRVCLGVIPNGEGKGIKLFGRYIPDFSRELAAKPVVDQKY
jgi:hypothetical protein